MNDSQQAAAGAALFGKVLATPGVIGVAGGALLFIFLWPKTAKEGVCRLLVAGLGSHFFGDAVLRTILNFMPWLDRGEIQAGAYLLAAWPAWWILGALVKWLNRDKDIHELAKEVKELM